MRFKTIRIRRWGSGTKSANDKTGNSGDIQRQSMLDYQRRMKEQHGRNNLETVFGVTALPYGRLGAEGTDRSGAGVGVDKALKVWVG